MTSHEILIWFIEPETVTAADGKSRKPLKRTCADDDGEIK
jgi:hypothetical protein